MSDKNLRLQVSVVIEIQQEAEDSFIATCPQLGCIFVHEETMEDAIFYAKEAVELYLKVSVEHGDPIPNEVIISREVSTEEHLRPSIATLSLTSDYAISDVA